MRRCRRQNETAPTLNETAPTLIERILAEHTRYGWGARKILKRLQTLDPATA